MRTPSDLSIGDMVKDVIGGARGEYLILLNNDTIITEGWLQLVSLVSVSEAISMWG